MFFGEYDHSLDDRNRLILPSRFREIWSKEQVPRFFLTRGFDTCLALYPEEEWLKEVQRLRNQPYQKMQVRQFNRLLYSRTTEVQCDKQYRLLLPDKFRQSAKIEKDIVIIGVENKIELWDKTQWEQFNNEHGGTFEEIAEHLFDSSLDSGEE